MLPDIKAIYVDCAAVVSGFLKPGSKTQIAPKDRRVWRSIQELLEGREFEVVKVPAHQKEPSKCDPTWMHRRGNHAADAMVKGVFELHPEVLVPTPKKVR
eukprot:1793315-Amphidinium_carterae.2